jgi:transposase
MEDVLDVYKRPYDPWRPLVCVDETSKQLIGETREEIPPAPGQLLRYDYEYKRNGVANLFMVAEPLVGRCEVKVTERRTKMDWAQLMKEFVDVYYRDAEKIVLVMDNLNTHVKSALCETFPPREAKRIADKLEIHYTPKHGSWLNMAEIELSVLTRQRLDRRISDMEMMKQIAAKWCKERRRHPTPVNWRFTTDDARFKLKRLYPSVQN